MQVPSNPEPSNDVGRESSDGGGVGYPRALAERQSAGRCVVAVMIDGVGVSTTKNSSNN